MRRIMRRIKKRCPKCKKLRKYEPAENSRHQNQGWHKMDGILVCKVCAAGQDTYARRLLKRMEALGRKDLVRDIKRLRRRVVDRV